MTSRLIFDIETYSECDLRACGVDVYGQHPSTIVLCLSYAFVDDQNHITSDIFSWKDGDPPPTNIPEGTEWWAWNVRFDQTLYRYVLQVRNGWPPVPTHLFRDLMVRAAYRNLPMGLDMAGMALHAHVKKDRAGHALMMKLCKPAAAIASNSDPRRHHTPDELGRLAEYCRQDVRAEAHTGSLLPVLHPMEDEIARYDAVWNERGIKIDLRLVQGCLAIANEVAADGRQELQDLTGGAVETETKLAAFVRWITPRLEGVMELKVGRGAFDKEAVQAYLAEIATLRPQFPNHWEALDQATAALALRSRLGLTSLAKFGSLNNAVSPDGRLRNSLQHYGAHQTGRWAGRLVQTHNLPKGVLKPAEYTLPRELALQAAEGDPFAVRMFRTLFETGTASGPGVMATLTSLLRTCFVADAGNIFCIADYSAVEGRGVLWLADDQRGLEIFRSGQDIYLIIAGIILGKPVAEVTKGERNSLGKTTVLGCGYGMGVNKFCATYNMDVAAGELAVSTYRTTFAAVPRLWKDVENAAKRAISHPHRECPAAGGKVAYYFNGHHLFCRLPSGRTLCYNDARLIPGRFEGSTAIEFSAEDQTTHAWVRTTTWGGSLVENITQAFCRDFLAHAMIQLENAGYPIVLHIHDELLAEVLDPGTPEARAALVRKVVDIMNQLPQWADGFPAATEGFTSPYWRK